MRVIGHPSLRWFVILGIYLGYGRLSHVEWQQEVAQASAPRSVPSPAPSPSTQCSQVKNSQKLDASDGQCNIPMRSK